MWTDLVDVFIMENLRPAQSCTQIVIQAVRTPKDSFPALFVDMVCNHLSPPPPVKPNSMCKTSSCSEETPAVVHS